MDDADYWFKIDVLSLDPVATANAVLSCLTKPSTPNYPRRDTRQLDEGVCADGMLAPPQYELILDSLCPVAAGKPFSVQDIWTDADVVEAIHESGPL